MPPHDRKADRYSHGHHESVLRSHLWRTAENSAAFLLPHLSDDARLLDIGCGPGNISADLATVLAKGSVIAIDRAEEIIDRATQSFPAKDYPNLSFAIGDTYALEYPDHSFDVVYAHQVLQHLSDPIAALKAMRRVLASDGLLAVRDTDYAAFVWWPQDPRLTQWMEIYHRITQANGANADAGRQLRSWVLQAGYREVTASSSTWTYADDDSVAWWGDLWSKRALKSEFAIQALSQGFATQDDLNDISEAFLDWSRAKDASFIVVHGEILARP